MELDLRPEAAGQGAMAPLAPGPLIRIGHRTLRVDIAPQAGGRIAQIARDGVDHLVGHGEGTAAMIAWGSYPMVPWAGRIRHGRFVFDGADHRLSANLGGHAIHGLGFGLPWRVEAHAATHAELSLALPEDARWPFGGTARQRIEVDEDRLRMTLEVQAGEQAMPAAIGWHPWFRKPDAVEFAPEAVYPRDAEGIAVRPLAPPPPGPWDDCFVNERPVVLRYGATRLRLTSDCTHWVVYDETAHATCVEPQTGPPDAFNLAPAVLRPGQALRAWYLLEWG